jgi:hypothetical protein
MNAPMVQTAPQPAPRNDGALRPPANVGGPNSGAAANAQPKNFFTKLFGG